MLQRCAIAAFTCTSILRPSDFATTSRTVVIDTTALSVNAQKNITHLNAGHLSWLAWLNHFRDLNISIAPTDHSNAIP